MLLDKVNFLMRVVFDALIKMNLQVLKLCNLFFFNIFPCCVRFAGS
ncbi:hypothetical protein HMPREF9554_01550 [Treponema phagedenis F0421]|nr:hypothetical protein HMPREF9554_01550 [Treponema phagedenis F0421]